jgi:hypothetical protein
MWLCSRCGWGFPYRTRSNATGGAHVVHDTGSSRGLDGRYVPHEAVGSRIRSRRNEDPTGTFLGVVGGMVAWGFTGMFKGAIILALFYTLFNSWLKPKTEIETPVA